MVLHSGPSGSLVAQGKDRGAKKERKKIMPSSSIAQQNFMKAELARKRAGKKTRTGMTEKQLEDFAKSRVKKK
jgi:hypothetical protein